MVGVYDVRGMQERNQRLLSEHRAMTSRIAEQGRIEDRERPDDRRARPAPL